MKHTPSARFIASRHLRRKTAGGIVVENVDFVSGMEPDAYDDDFVTDITVEFTVSGKALARLFGKQQRVLGRFLEKLTPAEALRALARGDRASEEILKVVLPSAKVLVKDYAQEELDAWPTRMTGEWTESAQYWDARIDPRREQIRYTADVGILGRWE